MGEGMTTAQAAEMTRLSDDGVRRILNALSRVLPIYCNDNGIWEAVFVQESVLT
jgi:hypothetical protein